MILANNYRSPDRIMEPLLSIQIYNDPAVYRPGDEMRFDYQVDALVADEISAVEASVLWITEGKGDEDFGVHFFERRVPGDAEDGDLRPLHTCHTTLPPTPLSYEGEILQVRWFVRLRVFVRGGKEYRLESPFVLSTTETPNKARLTPYV